MAKHFFYAAVLAAALAGCSSDDGDEEFFFAEGATADNSYNITVGEATDPESEGHDSYTEFTDNPFVDVAKETQSTFSVDCDGASYANMRRYVTKDGYLPPASSVRIEEFLNYFTFDYAPPTDNHAIAINGEVCACPWAADHQILRLGLKGKPISGTPKANYVFLIDVSGSMDSDDRLPLLKSSLKTLTGYLHPDDKVSIITYASEVEKLLPSTPISQSDKIINAINKLQASGATNGADALTLAYKEALNNYIDGGNNRIIMGTDGDFNVGVSSIKGILEIVEQYAKKGIYMTCCGFGRGNLNDRMMEEISNKGNGAYQYIDSEEEMIKVFVKETNKFYAVANDVKVQVEFNPDVVKSYRLIGYENRILDNSDFANDTVDASEIGAGQTITALYEIVPQGQSGRVCSFAARYKSALGESAVQTEISVDNTELSENSNTNFALSLAAYGMCLRKSPHKGTATMVMAKQLAEKSLDFDPNGYRSRYVEILRKAMELQKKDAL